MSIDLPLDIQEELRSFEARGDGVSHYELLGIGADADGGEIRRVYLERSKRFHPDSWYRKELGEFAPLLSSTFKRIAAAYQVLSDDETRAEYDRDHLASFSDADRAAATVRAHARKEEERRQLERRERLLRSKGFARVGAARKLYEEALELAAKGQRGLAVQALRTARELDPGRKEIEAKLAEVEREAAKVRAVSALHLGKEREASGSFAQALVGYAAAYQLEAPGSDAAAGAARCALSLGDFAAAGSWAARGLERFPSENRLRVLAARAFIGLKQKAKAREELLLVLQKEPHHAEAKALLKPL
jgi:curved DNA-binding protein CbpA